MNPPLNIGVLVNSMWQNLQQQGVIEGFTAVAAGIWAIVVFWEFANEALNVAMGEATGIVRKFVTYAALGLVVANWTTIALAVFQGAQTLLELFNRGLQSVMMQTTNLLEFLNEQGSISLWSAVTSPFQTAKAALLAGLTIITVDIGLVVTMALVVGTYAMLALHLCMGPIFMALGLCDALRSFCAHYVGAVIGYVATIPMYGAALVMIAGMYQGITDTMRAQPGTGDLGLSLWVVLMAPIIAVVIILSVARVAASIAGGIGAGAAAAVLTATAGGAASLSRAGGGGGAGGPAGSPAGGSGGNASSVKAALHGK